MKENLKEIENFLSENEGKEIKVNIKGSIECKYLIEKCEYLIEEDIVNICDKLSFNLNQIYNIMNNKKENYIEIHLDDDLVIKLIK